MGGSFYAFYFIHPNATDALSLTSYLPDALLISAHSGYSFFECPDLLQYTLDKNNNGAFSAKAGGHFELLWDKSER